MKDFTKTFFSWLDSQGLKPADVADNLGNNYMTVSSWRSKGIPKGKQFACQALMDKSKAAKPQDDPNATVAVEYSGSEFDEIDQAAKLIDVPFRDFIIRSSIARAREEIAKSALTNVTPITRVAEGEAVYKAHPIEILGAVAAGTGQDSDYTDTVHVANKYPEHYKGARVRGSSMDDGTENAIPDGCIAVIDTKWKGAPYATAGKIYAWATDAGQVIKKFAHLRINGETKGFLVSLNPDHADIPYQDNMIVQGEVVAIER